jgi:drug/metabolite transporter (DMT)-like permease
VLDAHWTPRALLSMLALGALGTCAANVLMTMAAGRLGATRASATLFLIPIVALVLGVVVRGEQVAVLSVAGAAVCLAGAWLIRRPAPASRQSPQPTGREALSASDRSITVEARAC